MWVWRVSGGYLLESQLVLPVGSFHCELGAEDIAELGSIAIPPTRHFLLLVIEVGGSEQVTKDHCGHIHLLILVLHHRDPRPIVPNRNLIVFPNTNTPESISISIFIMGKSKWEIKWEILNSHYTLRKGPHTNLEQSLFVL